MTTEANKADWQPISTAPEGKLVQTKIDDKNGCCNEQSLCRFGRLWFVDLRRSMYVYYMSLVEHWEQAHKEIREMADKVNDSLLADVSRLRAENARLKRGDFTPEEFQNLCHHRDEKPGCTVNDFRLGCIEYQKKMFGG